MDTKKICLLAIALVIFLLTPQSTWATTKRAVDESIPRCYKAQNADMAIDYCTRAIQRGKLSGKALAFAFYRRGNAYNEKSDYDRAIEDYGRAIRLNPTHANAFANRGVAYARKRDYDRAIQDYNKAVRLDPKHADAFSNRGVAYARKRDYDRAIQNYDAAIRLNPKHAAAFYGRGNAYRRKEDYDRAIQDYDQSIRLNPAYANAFSNRGVAYAGKGNDDRAIQDYNEAIRLKPDHVNALYNRGNAHRRKADYEAAIQDYDRVIELNPKHVDAYSNRGLARFYQKQFEAAVPDFSEAVRLTPNNLYRIILLYLAQARAGFDAQDTLVQATAGLNLEHWPGPIVSMYLGKVPENVVFESIVDVDPIRQRQMRGQAYFYVGQQLLLRQANNEAAKMFRETLALNSSVLLEYEGAQAELKHLEN